TAKQPAAGVPAAGCFLLPINSPLNLAAFSLVVSSIILGYMGDWHYYFFVLIVNHPISFN
ncbi:MAG TPA: hypothetical protein VNQ57_08055, partial [Ureibacillus sp.]|nr:hypothetical protein [Ureibacillus sp.]